MAPKKKKKADGDEEAERLAALKREEAARKEKENEVRLLVRVYVNLRLLWRYDQLGTALRDAVRAGDETALKQVTRVRLS